MWLQFCVWKIALDEAVAYVTLGQGEYDMEPPTNTLLLFLGIALYEVEEGIARRDIWRSEAARDVDRTTASSQSRRFVSVLHC